MKKSLFLSLLTSLLLTGCSAVQSVGDVTPPEIFIQLLPPNSAAIMLASTNSNTPKPALGCPITGLRANSYFLDLPQSVSLMVTSSDLGGVRNLNITLRGGSIEEEDVTNIVTANDLGSVYEINQVDSATIEITVTFSNQLTAQLLAFDVASNAEGLLIYAQSSNINGQTSNLPMLPLTGGLDHGGQLLDIEICDQDLP